jgi:transcriptional regulator with XRE-family HTH domain
VRVARRTQAVRKTFGDVLRELREGAKLTQEVLAHHADLTRNYVSMLERGERSPTIDTVMALAKPLKTRAHQILKIVEERSGG